MTRAFNFSPGPATLPEEVLQQAADEMLDWHGTGMSVMEISHRGADYAPVIVEAQADLRTLLDVPSNYEVLFMQGGALAENAIVPLNMMRGKAVADYVDTGIWSLKSIAEAQRYGAVNVIASSKADHYTRVPKQSEWQPTRDAAYVHICGNETIGGIEYQWVPDVKAAYGNDTPLITDMSSHILSRPVDVTKYGLIYGGAQKNVSMAGLTFVIVRDDLIGHAHPLCPSAFDYKVVADNDSMFNTPPTYAIYLAGLVFKWLLARPAAVGSPALSPMQTMEKLNLEKSHLLYDALDASRFYETSVVSEDRSRMNVTFRLHDDALTMPFVDAAAAAGLKGLKGHRAVGGIRASIYNAMPRAGVAALIAFMREFERTHG
ncbi:MAG: 3-phosphoserine/phosphohydroxythreonine transaminase [Burkholderiaceae bacterium]